MSLSYPFFTSYPSIPSALPPLPPLRSLFLSHMLPQHVAEDIRKLEAGMQVISGTPGRVMGTKKRGDSRNVGVRRAGREGRGWRGSGSEANF